MYIEDEKFDELLTAALYRASEIDCADDPTDEELETLIKPSPRAQRRMKALIRNPKAYIRRYQRPVYLKILRSAAAVFAAVIITFSGITIAAKYYDFGAIFDSIFNSREAAPFIQTSDGIILKSGDSKVTVEPIAAFFDAARDSLYLEFKIIEPTGIKLSDTLAFYNSESGFEVNTGPVMVRLIDEYTAIVGLFITSTNTGDTTVRFDTIASGITYYSEVQRTSFNIGENIGIVTPIVVPEAEFITITDLAIDDNRVTITHRQSDPSLYGIAHTNLGLMKPDGEVIWGSIGSETSGVPGWSDGFEIGDINPETLTLVWSGMRYEYTMTGKWEAIVSGDNVMDMRILNGEFEGNTTKVILGATSVQILISADYINNPFPYEYKANGAVTISLKDGTTVYPIFHAYNNDQLTASYSYEMHFVDPSIVESVTFCGTTITE